MHLGLVVFGAIIVGGNSFKKEGLRTTATTRSLLSTSTLTQVEDVTATVTATVAATVAAESFLSPHTLNMNSERHNDAISSCENLFPWHNFTVEEHSTSPSAITTSSWEKHFFPSSDDENIPRHPFSQDDLARVSLLPLLTDEECQILIDEADETTQKTWMEGGSRHGTQSNRVGALLPLERLPNSNQMINEQLIPRIFQSVVDAFDCLHCWDDLRVGGARVVRYEEAKGQVELGMHRDFLLMTVNIALNSPDEFEGGGTIIEALSKDNKQPIRLQKGHALLHPGDVRHAASPITSGKRYVLVLFLVSKEIIPHDRYVGEWAERCMTMAANTPADSWDEKESWLQKAAGYYADAYSLGGRIDRGIFPFFYYQAGLSR